MKKKKVIVGKVAKVVPSKTVEGQVLELRALLMSPGWQIVRKNISDNIEVLKFQILRKIDFNTKKELADSEVDRLRDQLNFMEDIIDTPEKIIEQLSPNEEMEEDPDPYYKNIKEIK
jgi:5-bromo-4-chloroindolyl phosphate hydrolysis protein